MKCLNFILFPSLLSFTLMMFDLFPGKASKKQISPDKNISVHS